MLFTSKVAFRMVFFTGMLYDMEQSEVYHGSM
jgi:hypothetical protein